MHNLPGAAGGNANMTHSLKMCIGLSHEYTLGGLVSDHVGTLNVTILSR